MEVRVIKTCQGFQKVLFLDGALVHPDVDLSQVRYIEMEVEQIERAAFDQFMEKHPPKSLYQFLREGMSLKRILSSPKL